MREVFVDESSQNGHPFMVLGALIVPGSAVARCEGSIQEILNEAQMFGEVKWTKVSRNKLDVYRRIAAEHFRLVTAERVEFSAMIVETRALDHVAFNQGDPELGFNKFLYELLWHRVGKRFGLNERIVVHLDSRNANRDLGELARCLNRKALREFGGHLRAPFARVAFRDSKNSRIMQIADLLSGAVAWHKNDHDSKENSSAARMQLANEIAKRTGRQRLGAASSAWSFNVWNFRLQPARWGAR